MILDTNIVSVPWKQLGCFITLAILRNHQGSEPRLRKNSCTSDENSSTFLVVDNLPTRLRMGCPTTTYLKILSAVICHLWYTYPVSVMGFLRALL